MKVDVFHDGNRGRADGGLLAFGLFEEQIRKRGDIWRRVESICKGRLFSDTLQRGREPSGENFPKRLH